MQMMEIAKELVAGCREGREVENLEKLYAADAASVEANSDGGARETVGLDGIRGKHAWWDQTFEVQEARIDGPYPHGEDRFAVIFDITAKRKDTGEAMPMKEIAVYHVADGKIVREEFFYGGA